MRSRLLFPTLVVACLFPACGGGGGGGGTPPQAPNDPPVMQVPTSVGGTGAVRSFTLATTGTDQLVFTAADPDGDSLQWQLQLPPASAAAAGCGYHTPVAGSTFTLDLAPVGAPVAVVANLLVEDPRGAAVSIDLRIVRSGAPTIAGVTPNSAFATRSQQVTVTGSALSLGGAVQTAVRFDGTLATATTTVDDQTLRTTTPIGVPPGATVVSVTHTFGSAQLPDTAFTLYAHPPVLAAADVRLDAGAGSAFEAVQDGAAVHVVWLEGSAVVHRASADGGASWTAPQTLSGGEIASEPQVCVVGNDVTVAWVASGNALSARSSHDDGATFAPAVPIDAPGVTVQRPRLVASGTRRYLAWQRGTQGAGSARLTAAASTDGGDTWSPAALVGDGGANQYDHHLVANGATAVLAFVDERQGASVPGVYTVRTNTNGFAWDPAQRRSLTQAAAGSPRLCADGTRVWLAWLRASVLEFLGSGDNGLSWPTVAGELRGSALGAVSEPALWCEGERLYAIYVLAGNGVEVTRVGGLGTQPQHVTVSATTDPAGEPRVRSRGNYVFATWRNGTVAGGSARIVQAVSTDLGATFVAPSGFGDGTAAQDAPQLLVDGARLLLLWRDQRTTPAGIFRNRTL